MFSTASPKGNAINGRFPLKIFYSCFFFSRNLRIDEFAKLHFKLTIVPGLIVFLFHSIISDCQSFWNYSFRIPFMSIIIGLHYINRHVSFLLSFIRHNPPVNSVEIYFNHLHCTHNSTLTIQTFYHFVVLNQRTSKTSIECVFANEYLYRLVWLGFCFVCCVVTLFSFRLFFSPFA